MNHYSPERKETNIKKMMPPIDTSVSQLSKETGISEACLYNWRKQAKEGGNVVPGDEKNTEQWTSVDKFSVVKTLSLNDPELATYCRENGLFTVQVQSKQPVYTPIHIMKSCKNNLKNRRVLINRK